MLNGRSYIRAIQLPGIVGVCVFGFKWPWFVWPGSAAMARISSVGERCFSGVEVAALH